MSKTMSSDLETRVVSLEEQVATLMGARPGRKPKPILVSIEGVCGVDPNRDSATCPDATLYRRQKGCMGTACLSKASEYYSEYRAARAAEAKAAEIEVAARKAAAKRKRQVKRAVRAK